LVSCSFSGSLSRFRASLWRGLLLEATQRFGGQSRLSGSVRPPLAIDTIGA
jgi:hypothetical protein